MIHAVAWRVFRKPQRGEIIKPRASALGHNPSSIRHLLSLGDATNPEAVSGLVASPGPGAGRFGRCSFPRANALGFTIPPHTRLTPLFQTPSQKDRSRTWRSIDRKSVV